MSATKLHFSVFLVLGIAALLWGLASLSSAPPASRAVEGALASPPTPIIAALKAGALPETAVSSAVTSVATSVVTFTAAASAQPLDDVLRQKYAILFSALPLSPLMSEQLREFLREREAIAARSFYDASTNAAEVAGNLRARELAIAQVDQQIAQLLGEANAQKYALLKDSTYEQAVLNDFYQVAGMAGLPEQQRLDVLLAKLAQKQRVADMVTAANESIANAAPATKAFLIEKTRTAFIAERENYLQLARAGLNDEQFELLRHYEQQLSDERWQDLLSSWQ